MADFSWSPRTEEFLKKKPGQYAVLGITMDGRSLTACGDAWDKPVEKPMERQGVKGFFAPWSLLAGRCARDVTREEAFADYLADTLNGLAQMSGGATEPVFAVFALPQRDIWKRDQEKFLQFLDSAVREKADFVYPGVTGLKDVLLDTIPVTQPTLLLSVEADWTEFYLLSHGQAKLNAAAAYGFDADPGRHRINDYMHGSTRRWEDFSAPSWEQGFQTILNRICGQEGGGLWPKKEMDAVRCARFVCSHPDAAAALSKIKLGGEGKPCLPWAAAADLARTAKQAIDRLCKHARQVPASAGAPSQKPAQARPPVGSNPKKENEKKKSLFDF